MFKVKVDVNMGKLKAKEEIASRLAQEQIDQAVLKDSNYYIPKDKSYLEGSGIISSLIGKGKIIWDEPYARRLYYNPQYNFSKDMNPNAQGLWFEAAKSNKLQSWVNIGKKVFGEQFRGG